MFCETNSYVVKSNDEKEEAVNGFWNMNKVLKKLDFQVKFIQIKLFITQSFLIQKVGIAKKTDYYEKNAYNFGQIEFHRWLGPSKD